MKIGMNLDRLTKMRYDNWCKVYTSEHRKEGDLVQTMKDFEERDEFEKGMVDVYLFDPPVKIGVLLGGDTQIKLVLDYLAVGDYGKTLPKDKAYMVGKLAGEFVLEVSGVGWYVVPREKENGV